MNPEKFNIGDNHIPSDSVAEVEMWKYPQKERRPGRVIITGGTEGIGKEIALEFADRHNAVAICARTQNKLNETKDVHQYFSPELIAERVDLTDRHAAKNFMKEAVNDLNGLDTLILNAAIFDFQFKSSDLSEEDIRKKMFQVNEVANVALIREAKKALKEASGAIVFITTRFGVAQSIETAPALDSKSAPVQEDVGNYIKNKKRMNEYLNNFIKDEENEGIFVFSIIPGTVNTPANRELIKMGTAEMSNAKIKERQEGRERNPRLIGIIAAKMAATRKKFNSETHQYDIDIKNGEVVEISNAAIEFEEKQRLLRVDNDHPPYLDLRRDLFNDDERAAG